MNDAEEALGPGVSIVIPVRDRLDLLARCLSSLRRLRQADVELVVVDDGSREIPQPGADATLVTLSRPRGFAGAANAGAAAAHGEYVAFVNSDVEVEEQWLHELVAALERHGRAAAVTGKLLRADDRRVLDGAGDAMTLALKAYRRGQGERDSGQYEREEEVFSAAGTASLWRRDVFHSLGGFDESFGSYYEDVDLGFRARLAGFECWYTPRAVAYHVGGASGGDARRDLDAMYAVRNRWATVIKSAPAGWLLAAAPVLAVGEIASLARALATQDLRRSMRAYRVLFRMRAHLLAERREIAATRVARHRDLLRVVDGVFPPLYTSLWRFRTRPRNTP
ncbi:MAG TPA: glycosyltransferase [Gaiellaceae bacterium]|nr:glycosyltransferase [Gaiellaceae bacterium]